MRGEHRKCPAFAGDSFALGRVMVGRADHAVCKNPVEDSVAGGTRGLPITIRPPGFRRLRQSDQKRRLGDRQALRLMAEIGKARRPQPLDIAAIRREREVKIKDARLACLLLDLNGTQHLRELRRHRFFCTRLDEPGHLHCQCRAARNDMAMTCPLQRGTSEAQKINSVMGAETMVFISNQHRHEAGIDITRQDGKPPAPVRRREGPQELAIAVDHDARSLARRIEVERTK